jgi:nicotinamide riboside transporter PnuC
MNYYCTDWITLLCNLIAIWLIGNGKKYGFVFGMVACTADFAFGYLAQSSAIMAGSILFTMFNIRAFYKWKKLKIEENNGNQEQGRERIQADQPQPGEEGTEAVE